MVVALPLLPLYPPLAVTTFLGEGGSSALSVRGTRVLRVVSRLPDPTPSILRPCADAAGCDAHSPTSLHASTPDDRACSSKDFGERRASAGIIRERYSPPHLLVSELLSIPYAAYLGVQQTIGKVRSYFWWKVRAGDIREFLESYPTCQLEKMDHT